MGQMMRAARLSVHSNDDTEESAQLWHRIILRAPGRDEMGEAAISRPRIASKIVVGPFLPISPGIFMRNTAKIRMNRASSGIAPAGVRSAGDCAGSKPDVGLIDATLGQA
jgi:hypothetical protein